jgi:hypothetical protein
MKKGFYAILAALAVFALVLTGCPDTGGGGGGGTTPPPDTGKVTISFNANGGPTAAPAGVEINKGDSLTAAQLAPLAPGVQGGNIWIFDGWYKETAFTNAVDINTTFNDDATLYAKWDNTRAAPTAGKVAVIYNFAWPIAGTPDAEIEEVDEGATATIGTLYTVTALQKPLGYEFKEWNTNPAGGSATKVTPTTVVGTPNPPLFAVYAIWEPLYTVTFNRNGGGGSAPAVMEGIEGATITLPLIGSMTAPDRRNFLGWSTKQKAADAEALTSYTIGTTDVILYAVWGKLAWPGADNTNTVIAEEISLANGWFAIYEFDLAGTTWSALEGISVTYKIADADTSVRARVFGNFVQSDIDNAKLGVYTPEAGGEPVNVAVVSSWPSGDTGGYILDNTWPGNTAASTIFGNSASPTPANDTPFTVTYPKPGSNGHAQWGNGGNASTGDYYRYKEGRRPVPGFNGKVYLGLGLSFGGGDIVTSQISDVKLTTASTPIPGKPLFFSFGGKYYRAYSGQLDDQDADTKLFSNTQGGKPDWDLVSGGDNVAVIAFTEPAPITVTYDANVTAGAVLDDEDLVPEPLELRPGDRMAASATTLPELTATVTGGGTGISLFQGWFTQATGGVKIIDRYQFDATTTIYGQWKDVADPITITYNAGGGTSTKAALLTEKNIPLTAGQLDKSGLTAPEGKASFGGWYKVDTTAATFDPDNFTNIVTTSTEFTANATIYAYWYAAGSTTVNGITVEALGGARIDKDGYVIFAGGSYNAWLNANANDTLLSFKFPEPKPSGTMKITYAFKSLLEPTLTQTELDEGWTVSPAFIWKKDYNNWNDATNQYGSVSKTATTTAPGEWSKAVADFDTAATGASMQFSQYADNSNKEKRAGYVYGVKIISITFE